jgi:ribonuclease-3
VLPPEQLQEQLQYRFNNPRLLLTALTHSSYVNESDELQLESNERLEFLGDAVLGLAVSDLLYEAYDQPEGILTQARNFLVSSSNLKDIAESLELGKYILLGRGEEMAKGRRKTSILENTLEALIGAIYLDSGYGVAREFTERCMGDAIRTFDFESIRRRDYKSYLQEKLQAAGAPVPGYEVFSETGPDHKKLFTVTLQIGDKKVSRGSGRSKKSAEQSAARAAAEMLEDSSLDIEEFIPPDIETSNEK